MCFAKLVFVQIIQLPSSVGRVLTTATAQNSQYKHKLLIPKQP